MTSKTFEIRDRATFIPVLATKLDPVCERDRYLLARAGYGTRPEEQAGFVVLSRIDGGTGKCNCTPFDWNDRTMTIAHEYIHGNFDELESGAVIDVRFILGETSEPTKSEQETNGL